MSERNGREVVVRSFTSTIVGRSQKLVNEVAIGFGGSKVHVPALWDTGATNTCIAQEIADAMGLESAGVMTMKTPSGMLEVPVYRIDLLLPNNVGISDLPVCGSEIGKQEIGVLVGMDVITFGDFAVSFHDGLTRFTFRVPSIEHADFAGVSQPSP
ncbi:MAG: retroviral-like aspartic protease family protein [Atopobiaceae bacterium]|nr:retroviral-like aspartic protease family protein [Atopobiaceae bacterium]